MFRLHFVPLNMTNGGPRKNLFRSGVKECPLKGLQLRNVNAAIWFKGVARRCHPERVQRVEGSQPFVKIKNKPCDLFIICQFLLKCFTIFIV